MATSLDPSSINVVTASAGGVFSPFDCSTGPDDSNHGWLTGQDQGRDDADFSDPFDC